MSSSKEEVPSVPGAVHFKHVTFTAYDREGVTLLFAHQTVTLANGNPDVSIVYYDRGRYLMTDLVSFGRACEMVTFLLGRGWVKREVVL